MYVCMYVCIYIYIYIDLPEALAVRRQRDHRRVGDLLAAVDLDHCQAGAPRRCGQVRTPRPRRVEGYRLES